MTDDDFNRLKKKILADLNRKSSYSNYRIETPVERENRLLLESIDKENIKQQRKYYAEMIKSNEELELETLKDMRDMQKKRDNPEKS